MSDTCKFDFSSKKNGLDGTKYREVTDKLGGMFFTSDSTPQNAKVRKIWFHRGCCATDSMESFDSATRIRIGDNRDDLSFTIIDVENMLPILQELLEDAKQVRKALSKVIPTSDGAVVVEYDDDEDDDDDED